MSNYNLMFKHWSRCPGGSKITESNCSSLQQASLPFKLHWGNDGELNWLHRSPTFRRQHSMHCCFSISRRGDRKTINANGTEIDVRLLSSPSLHPDEEREIECVRCSSIGTSQAMTINYTPAHNIFPKAEDHVLSLSFPLFLSFSVPEVTEQTPSFFLLHMTPSVFSVCLIFAFSRAHSLLITFCVWLCLPMTRWQYNFVFHG